MGFHNVAVGCINGGDVEFPNMKMYGCFVGTKSGHYNKLAVLTRWLYYQGDRKAGFHHIFMIIFLHTHIFIVSVNFTVYLNSQLTSSNK